ncbi:MAG: hypothetical protein ACRDYD_01360 [Acidimicrobiales bacterium]
MSDIAHPRSGPVGRVGGELMEPMNGAVPATWGADGAALSWRVWVTKHPIAAALLSGFVATHIATIIGYWLKGIGLPQLNWPVVNGNVVLPHASDPVKFVIGEVFIHGLDGVVFTLIFALFLYPLLRGHVSPAWNMARALVFALLLGTLSNGFMNPYVYFPHSGAGVFTTGFGWKTVLAVYVWHIAFGVNLGLMYNPLPRHHAALRTGVVPIAATNGRFGPGYAVERGAGSAEEAPADEAATVAGTAG